MKECITPIPLFLRCMILYPIFENGVDAGGNTPHFEARRSSCSGLVWSRPVIPVGESIIVQVQYLEHSPAFINLSALCDLVSPKYGWLFSNIVTRFSTCCGNFWCSSDCLKRKTVTQTSNASWACCRWTAWRKSLNGTTQRTIVPCGSVTAGSKTILIPSPWNRTVPIVLAWTLYNTNLWISCTKYTPKV